MNKSRGLQEFIIATILIIVGIALVHFSIDAYYTNKNYERKCVHAYAKVVGYERRYEANLSKKGRDNKEKAFYPKIKFTTKDGDTYIVTTSTSEKVQMYKINEKVKITYLPDNPLEADIYSSNYIKAYIPFAIFAIAAFVGSMFMIAKGFISRKGRYIMKI